MVMSDAQRKDVATVFSGVKGAGILDYVAGWYLKAAEFRHGWKLPDSIDALSSQTNSNCPGEQ